MNARVFTILLLLAVGVAWGGPIQIEWVQISEETGGPKGTVQLASGDLLATREVRRDGMLQVVCSRSSDAGETWKELSVIVRQEEDGTLGDGHLLQLPAGEVLFSYRHNRLPTATGARKDYAIRVAVSRNDGKTWEPHSTVATSSHDPAGEPGARRGLWSSFLLLTKDGNLQCYYDDEDTPHREGFFQHQWITMKRWDEKSRAWIDPVTVSRAHDSKHLSRDGMPSVVELPSGSLFCAVETVEPEPPHANIIRYTTSDDGGRSWSWKQRERGLLYRSPGKPTPLSVSPWLARLPTAEMICVFATDEDREVPGVAGTPPSRLEMDIKYVLSADDGETWSPRAELLFGDTHRNYMPGVILLRDESLLVTFLDFATGTCRAVRGRSGPD